MEGQESKPADGLNRASLLVMSLDKPVLASVLKHLSPNELTRLMGGYEAVLEQRPAAERANGFGG